MKKFLMLATALVAMVSCLDKEDNAPVAPETEKLPINISTSFTRATDSAFEEDDKVGVFVVNEPDTLITSGNHVDNMGFTYSVEWTPDTPIYWLDHTTKADFYCYYPYVENPNTSALVFVTQTDQSSLEGYKASDFLWGKTAGVAPTGTAVNITMSHSLSNILVFLNPGDGLTEESLAAKNIDVKICNVKTSATINLATGVATAVGNTTKVTPLNTGEYYRALIVPQTVSGETNILAINIDGVEYAYAADITFTAGMQHKIEITVSEPNDEVLVNFNIKEWDIDDNTYNTEISISDQEVADLGLLVDVQFNADGTATDKAIGYAITKETIGEGGTLTVTDGIATFGDSDENMSYFKIDLAQGDGSLKTSMNNGFTIETILAAPHTNTSWACPFGGEGFSLIRLAGYGYGWNINGWNTENTWRYTDGTIKPTAEQYYHVVYTYDATTGTVSVYRDGVYDQKKALTLAMRENSTVVIGARNDNGTVKQSWLGNMAVFRVYEDAINKSVANLLYIKAKSQLDTLNGVATE